MSTPEHWDQAYRSRPATELGWFQAEPRVSIDLIARVAPGPESAILDVGGGASTLVDGLIRRGYRDLTVLDFSSQALEVTRARLGPAGGQARLVLADALTHPFPRSSVDVWHDRGFFHFLGTPEDRRTYVAQVSRALRPNGHVVVATFALDGPPRCTGLDVLRYGSDELGREVGDSYILVDQVREEHVTPSGVRQWYQYCLFAFHPASGGDLRA